MPRGARLDAPGTLHHVMVRGIERSDIFYEDKDREDFILHMGGLAAGTGTEIFAWALMTNHVHILLKSGESGLSWFMRKLLSGYATRFNRRYQRSGHLFQNRYKSIVCEEEVYFMKLVSYIHLNPLRAGLVSSVDELALYPWSGHAVIMGERHHEWQDREYVLDCFGADKRRSMQAYQQFVLEQRALGQQQELVGGGLVRSMGGWSAVMSSKSRSEKQFFDERILGSGDFVKEIIDEAEASLREQIPVCERAEEVDTLLLQRCENAGISVEALLAGSRIKPCGEIRKELAVTFVREYGLSYADVARKLGVSTSAVSQMLKRL